MRGFDPSKGQKKVRSANSKIEKLTKRQASTQSGRTRNNLQRRINSQSDRRDRWSGQQ